MIKKVFCGIILLAFTQACSIDVQTKDIFEPERLSPEQQNSIPNHTDYLLSTPAGKLGIRTNLTLRPDNQKRNIVVLFHGNSGNVATKPWNLLQKEIADQGFNTVAVDYPGFGLSPGTPSIDAMNRASVAALATLFDHGILKPEDTVILYGASLGSHPALFVAADAEKVQEWGLDGLVLDSPISNSQDMVEHVRRNRFGGQFFNVRVAPDVEFDNVVLASNVALPTFFIHGTKDTSLPPWMTTKLASVTDRVFGVWYVEGGGHVDTFYSQPDQYRAQMSRYLRAIQ